MPTKDFNNDSWPENDCPDHHQNGLNPNDDNDQDDDDDDLFEDNVWNNLTNANGLNLNGSINHEDDNDNDDDEINHEYVLLSQDENAINNGQRQYYRHDYQVLWIETNEPLFEQSSTVQSTTTNNHGPTTTILERENNSIESNENSTTTTTTNTTTNDNNENDEKLDVDTIRNLMANFQLPDNHYPDWARNIPENEWHQRLRTRLTMDKQNNGT